MLQPTRRFSDRVADYLRYRPSYPQEAIDFILRRSGLHPNHVIADIGAGTGMFARLFLERGYAVIGVEPNPEMRLAAETTLMDYPGFRSVDGSAEHTHLGDGEADLITIAQAFHWFDRAAARQEFRRVLAPGGHVAIVFNERLVDSSDFLAGYEALLKAQAPEYGRVDHRNVQHQDLLGFFAGGSLHAAEFDYRQWFDWDGLRGRAQSSSYVPNVGRPGHFEFMQSLRTLFDQHAEDGKISFDYKTRVFVGQLDAG